MQKYWESTDRHGRLARDVLLHVNVYDAKRERGSEPATNGDNNQRT